MTFLERKLLFLVLGKEMIFHLFIQNIVKIKSNKINGMEWKARMLVKAMKCFDVTLKNCSFGLMTSLQWAQTDPKNLERSFNDVGRI